MNIKCSKFKIHKTQSVYIEYKRNHNTQYIAETRATLKDQSHANMAFKYSCALITLIPI